MDVIGLVDRFPQADEKISARELLLVAGGPALNAAITFAHLGGDATLVSSFGIGTFATAALAECRAHGVTVIDLAAEHDHPFPVSLVVSASESASRCIINSPATQPDERLPVCLDPPQQQPDIVLLDQFETEAAEALVPRLHESGVPIVLDGGGWKPVSPRFLDLATIPIVSSRFGPPDCRGPDEMAARFERRRFARWAITRGSRGVTFGEAGRVGRVAAVDVEAVDSSGAGDVFHGAFCLAHVSQYPFAEALRFAAAVAARSCRFAGPRTWMVENPET